MDILSGLNPQQKLAVETTEGPVLVLAGAGSGKTRVITLRIAYLISEKGVAPHNILAVTFTNKAAGEMRERVNTLLRGQNLQSAPLIATFHSLCVRILRTEIEHLGEGFTKSFTIYDTDDSIKVIKACVKDIGLDEKQLAARQVLSAISSAKNRGEDFESYASSVEYTDEKKNAIARVYKLYEERLHNSNALDFDDLMIKTVRLLRKSPEVRDKFNHKFKYILVDEYQDTNPLQFALVKYLTEKQQNICVVGDPDQSIYKFRQADIRNILEFEQFYPKTKTILLEQNYRSTQKILDVAHSVIANNTQRKDKKLWTDKDAGEQIKYFQALDGDYEARQVAAKIENHQRYNYKDKIAILYRTNAQSRLFEEALRRNRIEYNIVGGFSFYERAEIKDVISYLKLALNPFDDIALNRVINTPTRGLGKSTLDELSLKAKDFGTSIWEAISILTDAKNEQPKNLTPRAIESLKKFKAIIEKLANKVSESATSERPVTDVVISAIEDTGYANMLREENSDESAGRLENLEELVNAAVDYDKQEANGLRDFIDHAALSSDTDKFDGNAAVTLMTVHSAKGLEFPIVFLVGMEDGIFPHSRSINDAQELEEERRLAYVAITRAEKTLYISHAMSRRTYGAEMAAEPSMFLNEIPFDLLEDISRGQSWLSYAKSSIVKNAKQTARVLRGEEKQFQKPQNLYTGKTYNSTDAIAEFFKSRGVGGNQESGVRNEENEKPTISKPTAFENLKAASSNQSKIESQKSKVETGFVAGSHVRHAKYGKGLVLRREGSGDNVKLTISFPGFGQKKLIEKFANLEKA
ncbi:MAG: UvrD-helicase domain-containing protein [Pyrinomonadaceae bacterium]|nr:UvrD-helicase domain-containing protein [Pyrinomonadaceae bacterium]